MNVIDKGYKLPFIETPESRSFLNNKSAFENEKFVSETLAELLKDSSVKEVDYIPCVVNPLSVSTDASGKQRLILDLRYVNNCLYKERIAFEDWRSFENYVSSNNFAYKFDLKKGYHHVDIDPEYYTYLGFSWGEGKNKKYYVFTVLPFGLATAPMLFTKLLRPLTSFWHDRGVNICVYLDDGAGTEKTYSKTFMNSRFVKETLQKAGFVINKEKSEWGQKRIIWLGVEIDFEENFYAITEKRINSMLKVIENILCSPLTTARKLSKLAGSIVSTKFVLGDIINLKTRYLYATIEERISWDSKINILEHEETFREILFWKENLIRLNKRKFIEYKANNFNLASDASDTGLGVIFSCKRNIKCHKHFSDWERAQSSTWRELEGIRFGLDSFSKYLENSYVNWSTDNYAASIIVSKGSNKSHLQKLALKIHNICNRYSINLKVRWVPREINTEADELSKHIDVGDWQIKDSFFEHLNHIWGPFTFDRFASTDNKKVSRFNSKFYCPGTEGVNAFSNSWINENNLLVPPVKLIPKVLKHLNHEGVVGTLVIPVWKSASFWSLLTGDQFSWMIKDSIVIDKGVDALQSGNCPFTLLGSSNYKGSMIALRIDSR